ncbi:MAG TPA: KamA family radical SAM protein [Kofleriaceae bacterium]|nr:KamA family radical SAM protein [Kofleriaceae bacterium]
MRLPLVSPSPAADAASAPSVSVRERDVPPAQWNDWRWQLRHMLTDAAELAQVVNLSDAERDGLARSQAMFRVGLTPYYASLMDPDEPSCPVRMQAIPRAAELEIRAEELRDPLGEDSHMPAPCVVHKYPDRALLLVVDRCAIYCRHCNRRRLVGGDDPPSAADLDAGLAYLARATRIRDVLISGGDPFLLPTAKLDGILRRLRAIPHLETIRIGTRMPVVCPMRVDDELVAMLRRHAPLFVNTHFNHAKELTPAARAACERLVDGGVPVGNQTVLLRGINSSVKSLRALFRGLLRSRVRPYYLFQGDTVIGTDHLRTPVGAAIELYGRLRGWMSSMAIPHLVIDAPGGGGKLPIGPTYLVEQHPDRVVVRTYRGKLVEYPEARETDCTVAYDATFFAGVPDDDDREGSAEAADLPPL